MGACRSVVPGRYINVFLSTLSDTGEIDDMDRRVSGKNAQIDVQMDEENDSTYTQANEHNYMIVWG